MGYLPEGRQTKLKRQIALGEYRVDSSAVADEILRKLSLIRRAREEIEAIGADQSRRAEARHPLDR